jgi:hypothetical protein
MVRSAKAIRYEAAEEATSATDAADDLFFTT